jgi:lysophospholipase L1-like esterase
VAGARAHPRAAGVSRRRTAGLSALAAAATLLACAPARAALDVSVGDSYSSGEGAGAYERAFPACHRSPFAWPRKLGVASGEHLACSGAASPDVLVRPQPVLGPNPPPQVQVLAGIARTAEIGTLYLTIGGNDLGFLWKLLACRLNPFGCLSNERSLRRQVREARPRLVSLYRELLRVARPRRLVVAGYPDIVPAVHERDVCDWLDRRKRRNAARLVTLLDEMLAAAVEEAGAVYVPVRDVLDGHELCTRDPWMFGILDPGGPWFSSEQGHPTEPGQEAIARRVAAALEARDLVEGTFSVEALRAAPART